MRRPRRPPFKIKVKIKRFKSGKTSVKKLITTNNKINWHVIAGYDNVNDALIRIEEELKLCEQEYMKKLSNSFLESES